MPASLKKQGPPADSFNSAEEGVWTNDGLCRANSLIKGNHTMLSASLPIVTDPVRLSDLPALLGPYAVAAPVYVYLMSCGNLSATRFRLKDEEDLILVLSPRKASLPEAV